MSFASAVDHLHALGLELAPDPVSSTPRRKFDLEHMRILARALGDPQQRFPAVLIAGTNGKGSTGATLAAILAAAGYRTGLYTSPHLTRVTERIRIADPTHSLSFRTLSEAEGEESAFQPATFFEIPEADFARLYFRIDETAQRLVSSGQLPHHPSFFETLTALAFLYFAGERTGETTRPPVDIAILEVGMGGRLDATNIVEPHLSVITDIALDHQDYLGNTIAAIAREKAGILRPNGTLITLPQHPEANQAIGEAAIALNVRGITAADYLPGRNFAPPTPEPPPPPTRVPQVRREPFRADPGDATPSDSLAFRSSSGLQPAENLTPDQGALAPEAAPRSPLPLNNYDLTLDNQLLPVRSPLAGQHQQRNIALAIAAAIELRNTKSYKIPNAAIEAGIANTSWPGRLEFLPPNLLLDVAHNPAGAWTLRAAIATLPEALPRTLIFSCLRDKDLTEMAQILFPLFDASTRPPQGLSSRNAPLSSSRTLSDQREPKGEGSAFPSNVELGNPSPTHHLILTPVDSPRAASLEDLLAAARKLSIPAHPAQNPAEALALARSLTPANGLILATGSIYLVGALRELALGH
jgi:dihydrofolate synthase/folylpolyglutamate synthase